MDPFSELTGGEQPALYSFQQQTVREGIHSKRFFVFPFVSAWHGCHKQIIQSCIDRDSEGKERERKQMVGETEDRYRCMARQRDAKSLISGGIHRLTDPQ